MADKVTSPAVITASNIPAVQASSGKKSAAAKAKKPRSKPTHPKTADMVISAIENLKDRSGSSLQAIKKYVVTTYKVDVEKQAPFIKKYIKTAVASGALVQTKGKGAAGSFKLSSGKLEVPKSKALKASVKSSATKKPVAKKTIAKKASPVKKAPVKKPVTVNEKRKVVKGPAAKQPKAKAASSPISRSKSIAKVTPVKKQNLRKTKIPAKAKKPVPKKVTAAKKK
ncbi:histone H1 [Cephus cinctus]|uniref:Histone H1 n=1 Tax=Cephus cinctus TaxID=211228 RepID=A0AAJ7CGK6_CEPCN|nr:histone H1 [Cephus cinctus]